MFVEIRDGPLAAICVFRVISNIAAPCSSNTVAISVAISFMREFVLPI